MGKKQKASNMNTLKTWSGIKREGCDQAYSLSTLYVWQCRKEEQSLKFIESFQLFVLIYFSFFKSISYFISLPNWNFSSLKKFFFNIYLFLRDRERRSMSGGGAEREKETQSEAGCRLWAVSTEPDEGLEPTNCEIMTWAKVWCSTDWAIQAPQLKFF